MGNENRHVCECCEEVELPENETYCDTCLEYMTHHPFDWADFSFPVVALMFLALAITMVVLLWAPYHGAANAQQLARQDRLSSAVSAYSENNTLLTEKNQKEGVWYLSRQAKIYEKIGVQGYSDANNFLTGYYTAASLKKPWNHTAKALSARIEAYGNCYTYFSNAASSEDAKTFDGFLKAFEQELKGKTYEKADADYYRYYASTIYGEDASVQKKYIDAIASAGKDYENLYLPLYAEAALNEKNYEKTLEYTTQMLHRNKEDSFAYAYRGVAYRMTGNLPKAYNAINTGLTYDAESPSLNYQMAVYYLLSGETKLAEACAETAYNYADSMNIYLNAGSLYGLIAEQRSKELEKAGKQDAAEEQHLIYTGVVEEMKEYDYAMSGDVAKVLSGKTSVEDIFLKGEGDFTW